MLQKWLESTFIVFQVSNALELQNSVKPIKQTTLYYVPKSSELVIRAHYHTVDGTGMDLLCYSFLNALAYPKKGITFGNEPSRLPPIMDEVLGYTLSSKKMKEKGQDLFWNHHVSNQPAIGPVSKLGAAPSGRFQNAEVVFSTKITALLVQVPQSRYTAMENFNLRPYLSKPYNSSKYAAAVYYAPHPNTMKLPATYRDIAASLSKYYKTRRPWKSPAISSVVCVILSCPPNLFTTPVPKVAPVSSLGVVEDFIHRECENGLKVKDFKFGADVVLGMFMIFIYIFQEQLRLIYRFNDGFEDPENTHMYLKKI
ncbi:hypothetical protein FSARC_2777 [Fusarium sarcochroum]|uniref:Uncharacterized protein n=1 Tax=Fusarium sarcochroum TaxID=1208366 RepID=A0A8H4U5Z7_9HYPO|nr:hypothetical protein FSARC_2777 [Fusarium sarcochroum]